MRQPKLSIIIPVYNAEKYLEACIDSILSQSFQDFEIILVNDGSIDGSGKICDSYCKRDLRIRTFHKENGGVSSARNLGIDCALGEWFYFVDADDSLVPECLSIINKLPLDTEIVQFGYKRVEGHVEHFSSPSKDEEFISADSFMKTGTFKGMSLWIHFIKSSLVIENNIRFTIGLKYAEDLEFMIKCYAYSSRILSLKHIGYNYYIRELSAMSKAFTFENARTHLVVADSLINFFNCNNLSSGVFLQSRIEYMIKSYFSFSLNINSGNFNKREFRSAFDCFLEKHRDSKVINVILRKGIMRILRINPLLYRRLMSLKKIV